ncbi:MAG: hypothetical protein ABJC13_08920 [Acidobacteriota bacterium]
MPPEPLTTPFTSSLTNFRLSRVGRVVVALTLGFGLCRIAQAGVDRWTPYGPGEGALQSLVASTRGEMYVTSYFTVGEVWQLPDVNAFWRWRGSGFGQPAPPGITALAIHPKNPSALWAIATDRTSVAQSVFRSTDAGASWRKLYTGDSDFQIARLTIAPTARSVVLLAETGRGAPKRLWRSSDLGVSWTEVPGVLGPVAAAPDEPGTVYAVAASGLNLVKSVDGGATFHPAGALPIEEGDEVRALHATYGRPALVLASLRAGGLYRSTNGGGAWRRTGFRGVGPGVIASEPADPRKIYFANIIGLYASDHGAQVGSFRTVANLSFGLLAGKEPTALAAAAGGPYFLAGNDLYRYGTPNGFSPVNKTGIEAFGVAELRISPVDPSFITLRRYTGCIRDSCDFRTLLSTDGGATFSRVGAQISARSFVDAADLAFDPADPHRRLVGLFAGLVLLHEPDDTGLGRQVYSGPVRTVEFGAGGVLLVGGLDGIHRSDDDGSTWTQTLDTVVPPSPEHPAGGSRRVVNLEADPYSPEKLIAGVLEFTSNFPRDQGISALYRSTDAGITWTQLRDGGRRIEFIPGTPSSFYLLIGSGTDTELRRSDDFGTTSTLIHTFPLFEFASDVAADPNGSGDLYLASRLGVRRSRDGGATWEATPGGFNPFGPYRREVDQVQVAPDGRLIAAPGDGGLFENRLSN